MSNENDLDSDEDLTQGIDIEVAVKSLSDNGWDTEEIIQTLAVTSITNVIQALACSKAIMKEKKLFDDIIGISNKIGILKGDTCECIAGNIAKNSGIRNAWNKFITRFGNYLSNNMGDTSSVDFVKNAVKDIQKKTDQLSKTCNKEAIQKRLNGVHYAYIAGSVVCLAISWSYIFETAESIQDSTISIKQIKQKLKDLQNNEIKPILKFIKLAIKNGSTVTENEYAMYKLRISNALKLLNEWKEQIVKQKEKMKMKGFNSAISAVAMATSALTSFGMSGAGFTLLKGLGTVQGFTAGTHGIQALQCSNTYYKLNAFKAELEMHINRLEDAETKLYHCFKQIKFPKITDVNKILQYGSSSVFTDYAYTTLIMIIIAIIIGLIKH